MDPLEILLSIVLFITNFFVGLISPGLAAIWFAATLYHEGDKPHTFAMALGGALGSFLHEVILHGEEDEECDEDDDS